MKKIAGFLLVTVSVGFALVVTAAPVGNPCRPGMELGSTPFTAAVETDFVKGRDLDYSGSNQEIGGLDCYSLKLGYNFQDWVEFYLLAGMADNFEVTAGMVKYEADSALAWGVGQRILIHEFEDGWKVGADLRYRQTEPDVDKITLGGLGYSAADTAVSSTGIEYQEWQVALGVSKEMAGTSEWEMFFPANWIVIPYAGVKYSDVNVSGKSTFSGVNYDAKDIGSKDVIGVFLGLDVMPAENMSLGAEIRLVDEVGYSAGFQYRF